MVYCFLVMASLLFCSETVTCMELVNGSPRRMFLAGDDDQRAVLVGSGKEVIRKYKKLNGVDTIAINGGSHCGASGRIQLNITQVTNADTSEKVVIYADDNVLPYFMVTQRDNCLDIELSALNQKVRPSKAIVIAMALKKYSTITTRKYVDTVFLSPIQSDSLTVLLSSQVRMYMPSICAKKIHIELEDDSELIGGKKDILVADSLSINNKGSASARLAVKTEFLHVNNRGKGNLVLEGTATKQDLVLFEGSFCAGDLESERILVSVGKGLGSVQLWAKECISGISSRESQHEMEFAVPSRSSISLSVVNGISPEGIVF